MIKIHLIVLSIFVILVPIVVDSLGHGIIWGQKTTNDRLLFSTIEDQKPNSGLTPVREVIFPKPGQNNSAKITCIEVIDEYYRCRGGYVTLLEGGVNFNYVKLRIKRKWNNGFRFKINIYE